MGECELCGVKNLPICLVEEEGSSTTIVKWKHFSMENIVTRSGEEKKNLKLVYKAIVSSELINYLKPKLQFFAYHNFVARWQDKMFKFCLQNFPNDIVVSIVDFVENYSFEVQNEMQSMHQHIYQVTILVHITWIRNPHLDLHDETSQTCMKYYFYISNDKSHDNYFVQHCLLLHWEDIVNSGMRPKQHWIWSDGCNAQFKSKVPWFFVACYPHIIGGCTCLWNFFGSSHGKGPHDRARAMLKRFIKQAQLDV